MKQIDNIMVRSSLFLQYVRKTADLILNLAQAVAHLAELFLKL